MVCKINVMLSISDAGVNLISFTEMAEIQNILARRPGILCVTEKNGLEVKLISVPCTSRGEGKPSTES